MYTSLSGGRIVVRGRTQPKPLPLEDRYWAVGCNPARKAHRVIGEWPGHGYMQTACKAGIALHADTWASAWPFPLGGMSFDCVEEIPDRYTLCLKCVAADETVV